MKHKYFEVVLSTFTAAATLTLGRKIKFEKQKNMQDLNKGQNAMLHTDSSEVLTDYNRRTFSFLCYINRIFHLCPPCVGVVPPDPGWPGFRPWNMQCFFIKFENWCHVLLTSNAARCASSASNRLLGACEDGESVSTIISNVSNSINRKSVLWCG